MLLVNLLFKYRRNLVCMHVCVILGIEPRAS